MGTQSTQVKNRETGTLGKSSTYSIAFVGVFAGLIAICSWISIPTAIPFTLQTFAVFLAILVLGGKRGTLAVTVYVLLGAVGVPVFAEFTGGIGIIINNTGGYIIGFIFMGLTMWLMERLFGKKGWVRVVSMLTGLVVLYAFGTAWFMLVYLRTTGAVGGMTVLGWCVFPFIIPDLIKLALALLMAEKLRRPLAGMIGEN